MKLHVKNDAAELYNSLEDCRPDKKGYGCVTKNGKTYYFDLVTISDVFASKMRYKKKGSTTTYAIGDSNLKDLSRWASKTYPSTYNTMSAIPSDGVKYLNSVRATSLYFAFMGCSNLSSIDVSKWDTSHVTSMHETFSGCQSLTTIDISKWNTSKVTTMFCMFKACYELTSIKLGSIDTSNVTNMYSMFLNDNSLKSIDVTHFNTSKVVKMDYMFSSCESLTSLDLSNFDTSKVTDMQAMFFSCTSLKVLDLSNFDTRKITDKYYIQSMFSLSRSLQYLIISSPTFKFKMIDPECSGLRSSCKILVPRNLLNTYKTAANWSSIASQFEAIENYTIKRSNGQVTVTPRITWSVSGKKITVTRNDPTLTNCRIFIGNYGGSTTSSGTLSFSNNVATFTPSLSAGSYTIVIIVTNSSDAVTFKNINSITVNSTTNTYYRIDNAIKLS